MTDDLDGVAKNLDKFKREFNYLRQMMVPHVSRWIKQPWNSHAYVNLWVEALRASPYLTGHVLAVLFPLLVLLIFIN